MCFNVAHTISRTLTEWDDKYKFFVFQQYNTVIKDEYLTTWDQFANDKPICF